MKPYSSHRNPVRPSNDLARILAIPRRPQEDLTSSRGAAFSQLMTARLSNGNTTCNHEGRCIQSLKPVQAWALYEASITNGLLGAIGVGCGKTLLGLLMPMVVKDCKLAVLLIPPSLKEQLLREYKAASHHFRLPSLVLEDRGTIIPGAPVLQVIPYSMFSRAGSTDYLEKLQPDLIIADEIHNLKNKHAARTARVLRYFSKHPDTRLCGWSGTITSKSVKDYAHLSAFALDVNSPLPLDVPTLEEWALALDPSENVAPPGALIRLCQGDETPQQGYHRRLVETRGVVATRQASVDASITILERTPPKIPASVAALLKDMRTSWTRPDGEELTNAMDVSGALSELSCGFYYRWRFPKGEPRELIDEWFSVRQQWNKELREKLKNRTEHLDSPLLCENAARRYEEGYTGPLPKWRSEHYRAWTDIKNKVYHESEAVWVDDWLARDAAKWAIENKGVVWYQHNAFGERISQLAKLPKHGGGPDAESLILSERGDRSIIASIHAHGTGRDGLQRLFDTQLVTNPPGDGLVWEQLLGRLHRQGQESDEVTTYVYRHTPELKEALDRAFLRAQYVQATLGNGQKILSATVGW